MAVIKIFEPISPMLNYYEFKILERGESCCIAIGAGSLVYPQVIAIKWIHILVIHPLVFLMPILLVKGATLSTVCSI